jgi:uncharacterized membrane protein YoaK (UPF0700 family)
MTATAAPTTAAPTTTGTDADARTTPSWKTGLLAAGAAAVATTAVAGVALAAGVPLTVGGEQIPLLGFAQMTILFSVLGILIAKGIGRWTSRPQRTFLVTTVALTALSIVPDFPIDASPATKATLITTHLVAAAIVVPTLARQLRTAR